MSPAWKTILWRQYSVAIDNLQNALHSCPTELWQVSLWHAADARPEFAQFWYVAYHAIWWLDYDCSASAETYTPPAPFTTLEPDMDGVLPERVYTKTELLNILEYARRKCQAKIESLTDENEPQRMRPNWYTESIVELLLYDMRHVEEHAAQLNMFLGQHNIFGSDSNSE